jgi:hypothetical protein
MAADCICGASRVVGCRLSVGYALPSTDKDVRAPPLTKLAEGVGETGART